MYNSKDKNEGYYVGNLLLHDKNEKINGIANVCEVIDGQQRITTIALLFYLLATKLGEQGDELYINIKPETSTEN